MVGVYFSGTGNTEHCVKKLVKMLDASAQCFPLEHTDIVQILKKTRHNCTRISDAVFKCPDYGA